MTPPTKKTKYSPKVGEKCTVQINGMTHAGEGVARRDGMAVFIPGALPGETVEIEVTEVRKNYARAALRTILEPAAGRTAPVCPSFNGCGGCRLQHVDYPTQLELKTTLVRDSLVRIGRFTDPPVQPALGMADPAHYRNKVHFQVMRAGERIVLGFFAEGSHRLTPWFAPRDGEDGCLLLDRRLIRVAAVVEELLNKHRVPLFDWKAESGYLRHVMLRLAAATGAVMVVLVSGRAAWPEREAFVSDLRRRMPEVVSVIQNYNSGRGRDVLGPESTVLSGTQVINDYLGGLRLQISAASFYQVNPQQTLRLYERAADYAALSGTETMVDVYSGIGSIALYLAQSAGLVYGLEIVPHAVADARTNAALNGIDNVHFREGKAEELLPALAREGVRPDVIVLDPPRKGCAEPVLDAAVEMHPPRIVYVSCDPGTLARDLRRLTSSGYRLYEAQPVDMFPYTTHVETVVLMSRVK